jgi:hypothetical protein
MADTKISGLTSATTPLAGTEVLPIVQSGTTKKVSVDNLTSGKAVSALSLTATTVNATTFDTNVAAAGVTLSGTTLSADGTNANIDISLVPQGTGDVIVSKRNFAVNGSTGSAGTSTKGYLLRNSTSTDGNNFDVGSLVGAFSGAAYSTGYVTLNSVDSSGFLQERVRLLSNGNTNINNGNLVIGTSGKGIDFSATPGTGTSELFDDYEEGTWSPTVISSSGTITTLGTITAEYTKIGNVVTLVTTIAITTNGTGAGHVRVSNLPFTPSTAIVAFSGYGRERSVSGKQLQADLATSTTYFNVYNYDNTYPGANGATLVVTVIYVVA